MATKSIGIPIEKMNLGVHHTQDDYYVKQIDAVTITPNSVDGTTKDNFQYSNQKSDGSIEDDQVPIHTYPSGRLPLFPLHVNSEMNSRHQSINKKIQEAHPKSPENISWLSKTFCVVPSNSTLDEVHEYDSNEVVKSLSYDHQNVCFISDEGSMMVEDETDDITENQGSFYQPNDVDYSRYPTNVPTENNHYASKFEDQQLNETFDSLVQTNLICNSWSNWYDDMEPKKRKSSLKSRQVTSHLFNSSRKPLEKKKRMELLRSNLEPFGVNAFEVNPVHMASEAPVQLLKKSVSFCTSKPLKTFEPRRDDHKRMKDCGWHSNIIACGHLSQTQEIEVVPTAQTDEAEIDYNEELCYDSDPGEMAEISENPKKLKSRSHLDLNVDQIDANDGDVDEATTLEIISEQMTTKRLLVWHRQSFDSKDHPVAVHMWIEHGSQLHSILVQPKLCWREICHEKCERDGLTAAFSYHAVDLLDISKILPLDVDLDRARHPFAKGRYSFLVEAFGGCQQMVFEARNAVERDNIIEGLKLIVSRLGSKIMVGDSSVLKEFFSPLGSVPGNIPSIITGGIDNC